MRLSKIALGVGLAVAAITAANAAKFTMDYRHDYRTEYGENFDRICFIAGFDNGVGFYVDSSFKSGTNRPKDPSYSKNQWGDFVTNATEMGLSYNYKIAGTGFTLQPGLITESTSSVTAYKPYFRVQYNTDFGLWFAIRPRFDYQRNDATNNKDGSGNNDNKTARLDAWVGYNYGNFGINYNFTYMKDLNGLPNGQDRDMYDGKDHNYEHNVAVNYRIGQWNPYFEIGDIAGYYNNAKTSQDRQFRIRVGVQYSF